MKLTASSVSRTLLFINVPQLCIFLLLSLMGLTARAANVIQTENAKPGTSQWQLTNPATSREIEGYASLTSVPRGGQIRFYVNTADPSYTIEFFRMGWYGGLGGRRMTNAVTRTGVNQPMPVPDPVTGLIECNWTSPYTFTVPTSSDRTVWASGVYLAKLTALASGKQSYIIFVVRDDSRSSSYLFQSSVTTFQAYNNWGGKSLYSFNSPSGPAQAVSFNRPYGYGDSDVGYNDGSGEFHRAWEYNMVRFLEREGYDTTYCTDIDTHSNPNLLLNHKAFLVVGHDEYWSWQMRANVEAARDRGVNLGIFSANVCYWQIRLVSSAINGASNRTIICYKSLNDPYATDGITSNDNLVTVRWRDAPVNRPEDALLGVMYNGADPFDGDFVVADDTSWVFANTGLRNGDLIPGMAGSEVDRVFNDAPPNTWVVAHAPMLFNPSSGQFMPGYTADMVTYVKGATVFSTGCIQWSWGLDDYNAPTYRRSRVDAGVQQITRNVLARFVAAKNQTLIARPGGPYNGTAAQAVRFDGTSSVGLIGAYQWDFGDGTSGFGGKPSHAYAGPGTYTVKLTVTDNGGVVKSATTTATITSPPPGDYSLVLNGSTYMEVPSNDSLNIVGPFTVEAWIKTNSATAQQGIVERYNTFGPATFDGGFAFRLTSDGKLQLFTLQNGNVGDVITGNTTVTPGVWHHVAGVFDGAELRVYLDGAVDGLKPSTFVPSAGTASLKVGARGDDGNYKFIGLIDEVRLTAEVLYTTPFSPLLELPAIGGNSRGDWQFTNLSLDDASGRENNGTVIGVTTFSRDVPGATAPAGPTGLSVSVVSSSQLNLAWSDQSDNENGFLIERSTNGTSFTQITAVSWGVTTFSDTGLSPGTTYNYRVQAFNDVGNSGYSNTANATTTAGVPAAPSNLTAAASLFSRRINLNWSDNSNNETSFKVERSTSSSSGFSQIASLSAGTRSYADTSISRRVTYYYRVRASNAAGNSPYSNVASARKN
jgi:PKD repeat protein